jgi:hypothetical protein
MENTMDESAQEIKYFPLHAFTITIETHRPLEIELAQRFLAELNELREVPTSRLAGAFDAWCEEPKIVEEAAAA